jgi:hypothetical protein
MVSETAVFEEQIQLKLQQNNVVVIKDDFKTFLDDLVAAGIISSDKATAIIKE